MIGCDIRSMSDETKAILMNKDVIEINQDPAARQPFLSKSSGPHARTYLRLLENGDIAVGMFNLSDEEAELSFDLDDIGFTDFYNIDVHMKDLWSKEETDLDGREYKAVIAAHGCKLFRVSLKSRL